MLLECSNVNINDLTEPTQTFILSEIKNINYKLFLNLIGGYVSIDAGINGFTYNIIYHGMKKLDYSNIHDYETFKENVQLKRDEININEENLYLYIYAKTYKARSTDKQRLLGTLASSEEFVRRIYEKLASNPIYLPNE